jgi:hypothetical protein
LTFELIIPNILMQLRELTLSNSVHDSPGIDLLVELCPNLTVLFINFASANDIIFESDIHKIVTQCSQLEVFYTNYPVLIDILPIISKYLPDCILLIIFSFHLMLWNYF